MALALLFPPTRAMQQHEIRSSSGQGGGPVNGVEEAPPPVPEARRGLLGEILIREGLINEGQLSTALMVQRETEPDDSAGPDPGAPGGDHPAPAQQRSRPVPQEVPAGRHPRRDRDHHRAPAPDRAGSSEEDRAPARRLPPPAQLRDGGGSQPGALQAVRGHVRRPGPAGARQQPRAGHQPGVRGAPPRDPDLEDRSGAGGRHGRPVGPGRRGGAGGRHRLARQRRDVDARRVPARLRPHLRGERRGRPRPARRAARARVRDRSAPSTRRTRRSSRSCGGRTRPSWRTARRRRGRWPSSARGTSGTTRP